jgi:hypothetical protein
MGRTTALRPIAQAPAPGTFGPDERRMIRNYRTPRKVQNFLHRLPYNAEEGGETLRGLRGVVKHGTAHCLEAALLAATILEQHGYPPLLLDIESQDNLDHVLFLFRRRGRWGAVAKSREAGLHGRKPVFRTVRQLVQSYVDPYVDRKGRITGYGVADLRTLVRCDWRRSTKNLWKVEKALIHMPHRKLKTSDRHYRTILRRYLAFKKKNPGGNPAFYSGMDRWT